MNVNPKVMMSCINITGLNIQYFKEFTGNSFFLLFCLFVFVRLRMSQMFFLMDR